MALTRKQRGWQVAGELLDRETIEGHSPRGFTSGAWRKIDLVGGEPSLVQQPRDFETRAAPQ